MLGENPVEPIEKIELLGRRRPGMIVEAAARDREQPTLPVDGQLRVRRDSSPASQQTGDGGLPGKKIPFDLQLADLSVQIVDYPLPIVDCGRLVAPREQFARTLRQLLLPGADHRRMDTKFR
jgi:hypothetical protein